MKSLSPKFYFKFLLFTKGWLQVVAESELFIGLGVGISAEKRGEFTLHVRSHSQHLSHPSLFHPGDPKANCKDKSCKPPGKLGHVW